MKNPACSLIVGAYNQARQLALLLESAGRQTRRDFEIIIADDGSSDDTSNVIGASESRLQGIPVRHLWHEDLGFRKTIILNQAVRESSADYLVFVDGDMILHPLFIEMHLLHAHPDKVWCGWRGVKLKIDYARRLMNRETGFDYSIRSIIWRSMRGAVSRPFRALVLRNKLLRELIARERGRLSGCNYSLFRYRYEQANGMDETILQYGYEDYEFGHRLQLNGMVLEGISHCANTYHLEHPKKPAGSVSEIKSRIDRATFPRCRHGLELLSEGSSNDLYVQADRGMKDIP